MRSAWSPCASLLLKVWVIFPEWIYEFTPKGEIEAELLPSLDSTT
jgi:hypothetical protein